MASGSRVWWEGAGVGERAKREFDDGLGWKRRWGIAELRDQLRAMDAGAGAERLGCEILRIARSKLAARLSLGDEWGNDRAAVLLERFDRRPALAHRDFANFMDARLIDHLVAHAMVHHQQHSAETLGGRAGTAGDSPTLRDDRAQLTAGDGLGERLFRRIEAIDVGARHAEPVRDGRDRRARPEFADEVPRDLENASAGLLGAAALGDVRDQVRRPF